MIKLFCCNFTDKLKISPNMSNVTREDILKDAPDFVQIASKYMQDIYIDYEKARIKLDECPDRFLTYEGRNDLL